MNIKDMVDHSNWRDSLKEGDQVACKTRRLGGVGTRYDYGYQVFRIVKITPKRTRFDVIGPDSERMSFDRDCLHRVGDRWSAHTFELAPLTPEVYEEIGKDTILIRAENRRYRLVKKLGELSTFLDKGPDFHLEFVGASDQLLALLDKHTKPDPEDS